MVIFSALSSHSSVSGCRVCETQKKLSEFLLVAFQETFLELDLRAQTFFIVLGAVFFDPQY